MRMENTINSTLPIGQYIFWGTIAAVLIATIVYRGGISFFFGNLLMMTYRIIVYFIWYVIFFEEGHSLLGRIVTGLFFIYPLYGVTRGLFEDGIFFKDGDSSSGQYRDIDDQGAVDIDEY